MKKTLALILALLLPLSASAVYIVDQGGTGSTTLSGILKGNGKSMVQTATAGTDYVLPSALSSYLTLSSWYATTTDGLDEGLTNLYFTNGRVQTYLSGLDKGYFFSTTSADYWITTKSLTAASSTLLGDTNTWSATNQFAKLTFTNATGTNINAVNNILIGTSSPSVDLGIRAMLDIQDTSGSMGSSYGMIHIRSTDSLGGNYEMRMDSPNPDIEFVETDQTSPSGKFEFDVNNDSMRFNGRNSADNSFYHIIQMYRQESSPLDVITVYGTSSSPTQNLLTFISEIGSSGVAPGLAWKNSVGNLTTARISSASGSGYAASNLKFEVANPLKTLTQVGNFDTNGVFTIGNGLIVGNSTTTNATSSSLAVTNLSAGLVKALAGGSLVNATAGVDYQAPGSYITLSSLSASAPIVYNSGTGAFSWTGLATTSQPALNNLLLSNGGSGVSGISTSSLGLLTTNVAEGSNLYFTNGRAQSALAGYFATTTVSNTWAGTQTFTNAPIFSSLTGILKGNGSGALTVASLGTDYVNGSGTNGNCVAWGASNALTDAGAPCGSGTGGGASQWATSTLFSNMVHTAGAHGIGIGTTTPKGALSMASSSMVEMWWNHTSASANQKLGWMSWANGIFNIGTSSDAGATTSILRLDSGTTTVYAQRLSVGNGTATSSLVAGAGTSTPNGGIDLSAGGCYAVLGSCIGVMALNGSVGQVQYYSGVNTAVGTSSLFISTSQNVGIGTSSPYAKLSVQGTAGLGDAFAVASSTLATMFNVTANGRVGIGSSTPWGTLSIIDSISGSFFPGVITATSTADMPYFGWTASTSEYAGSAVRILAGNPSAYMSSGDSLDQLLLNGRINTGDWKQMECSHAHAFKTAQITSDITGSVISTTLGVPCGDFSYIEDANGVADSVVTTGSGYIRLRPGATGVTVVAGDGMGLAGTTAFLRVATNTPVFLATARMGAVQNASTSIYMLGFSAATGVSADYATDAQNGCFFVASSTKANWQAVARNTTATIVDTGVASSTVTTGDSAWRQFRIDMIGGPTPYCVFRIKQSASASWGPPVATISTNIPTGVSLNPITSVGKVSAGISPELHINRIRVWYNDPLWY